MRKRIAALVLLTALFLCCIPARATETQEGSIRFIMDFDGTALTDGSLKLYRVADLVEEAGQYDFALVEPLEESGIALGDLTDPNLAGKLAQASAAAGLETYAALIQNGEAWFPNLPEGLYVVFQDPGDASTGYAPIDPFLISIPMAQDGKLIYQIEARPKVAPEMDPTVPPETEPDEPGDPSLPQTGQLNWPVPVLAVSGMLLLLLGWYLRFGGEREYHET